MTNTVSNKINEVETRFNALTSSQQQDAEVIDARADFKGVAFNSLKERIDYTDKLLRDSTISTITTESDFTTVEATSNGYFEDVKLEGKTLVNLAPKYTIKWTHSGTWLSAFLIGCNNASNSYSRVLQDLKPNTEYTVIVNIKTNTQSGNINLNNYQQNTCVFKDSMFIKPSDIGVKTFKVKTVESFDHINPSDMVVLRSQSAGIASGETLIENIMILEGDHTQNPPNGYIEGLKSVGQSATTSDDGVDEISVESVNENLFDVESFINFGLKQSGKFKFPISLEKNTTYTFSDDVGLWNASDVYIDLKNKNDMLVYDLINPNLANRKQITFTTDSVGDYYFETYANNIPRMLNITTNFMLNKGTTPKQYTPHKSDKKRLLFYNNETQTWEKPILREWDSIEKHSDGKYYYHVRSKEGDYVEGDESLNDCITDLTVSVKKLAEEKVYECTNIDLITYANETNYIVNCGAIVPKTTLKVHNNISNVVSLLQKKVSILESDVTSYMITQNRLMLASRYNADNVTFKVDYPSMMSEREVEIDYDLFKLIQDNIIVGPENYDVDKMLEIMDLYAMIGFITWEMWDYLYEVIDSQINPVIGDLEGTPEI